MLKSTGSEFAGFPRDRYTTLVETDDRIMATSVTGRWRFLPEAVEAGIDYNGLYAEVSAVLLSTFATVHSLALQQTLFAMGKAAIEARPEIAEVRFAMPNKHHFLSDLVAVRAREPRRGLLRRRPPLRPDRGHDHARRRGPGAGRLARICPRSSDGLRPAA